MENNEIAANGMISENTENTENTENKCAEKTNGVAGPGRNAYDVLNERGFLKQCSHPEELRELLGKEKLTFYIGFDPTAESLTVGHYVAEMRASSHRASRRRHGNDCRSVRKDGAAQTAQR